MLESPATQMIDTPAASDNLSDGAQQTVQELRALLDRLQGKLKFKQTKIDALNFEVMRLKRWRFGSSSESLDTSTQAVLFDQILVDTAIEDRAAEEANKPPASPPRAKGKAVRQALPAGLPRIEHHHELSETHCACGQAFKRIGEEVSEQHASRAGAVLRAAPHPRQIRLRVLPDDCRRPHARADDRQGHTGPGSDRAGGGGQAR